MLLVQLMALTTHWLKRSSRHDTNVSAGFYCARKGFNSVILQVVCDADNFSRAFVAIC